MVFLLFVFAVINFSYQKFYAGENKLFINWFLLYLPYYLSGHLLRVMYKKLPGIVLLSIFSAAIAGTAIGCYLLTITAGLGPGFYFYGYLSITVIPMSISVMLLLRGWSIPIINRAITKKAALLTLGIYIIHPVFIDIFKLAEIDYMKYNPVLAVPVFAIAIFILSFFIAWLIYQVPYLRRTI